jgi:hypothetical protein
MDLGSPAGLAALQKLQNQKNEKDELVGGENDSD